MISGLACEPGGVVLLVDHFTTGIISNAFRLSELLEENIQLIENVAMRAGDGGDYLKRQPLPKLTAVYFLTPTIESVNRLISDFKDQMKPMSGPANASTPAPAQCPWSTPQ